MTISVESMNTAGEGPEDLHAVHDDVELTDQERAEMARIAMTWTVIHRQPERPELPFDEQGNPVREAAAGPVIAPSETAMAAALRLGAPPVGATEDVVFPQTPDLLSEAARQLAATPRRRAESGELPLAAIAALANLRPGGDLVLPPPSAPMDVAEALRQRWLSIRFLGTRGITRSVYWRGDWYDRVDSHYQVASEEGVERSVRRALRDAEYVEVTQNAQGQREERRRSWNPTNARVRDVMSALKTICAVGEGVEAGSWVIFPTQTWLEPYPDESRDEKLISLTNVMVNVQTRETASHDPAYLTTWALPFAYEADAECPAWEAFLDSVFPGDKESKALLQEWFGYVLSGRTDLHRLMYLKGLPRSGKGTIARILSKLLGEGNVAGPTLNSFASDFGLASLIGKPLAVVGDVRNSPRLDIQTVTEKLLMITGEDKIDVNRKHRDMRSGTLPTRLMMLSNELPWFRDTSGGITSRMLLLVFNESFLGREDRKLEAKLTAELPGILNWALAGLARLDEEGGVFTEPKAAAAVMQGLADTVSPIKAFLRQECETGREKRYPKKAFYAAWATWCVEHDATPGSPQKLLTLLQGAVGDVTGDQKMPRAYGDGSRPTCYTGVEWLGSKVN